MWSAPLALGCLLGLISFADARAACGDDPGDAQAVQDARGEIGSMCGCDTASRAEYVRCVDGVVATRVGSGALSRACGGAVKRCARKSTCGRPGAVTCCIARPSGTRCVVRRSSAQCAGCVGAFPSCCDACDETGCATTTTTTTIPCAGSGYPQCGGTCPPNQACQAFVNAIFNQVVFGCMCVDVDAQCGPLTDRGCHIGRCPGAVCAYDANGLEPTCGCFPF